MMLTCFLCQNQANISAFDMNSDRTIQCDSCGNYVVSSQMVNILQIKKGELKPVFFSNLRGWIHENQQAVSLPKIDEEIFEKIKNKKQIDVHEKAYRLLKWLHRKTDFPGQSIKINDIVSDLKLPAICYSNGREEIMFLLKHLAEEGHISSLVHVSDIVIKHKGFSYIEQYEKNTSSNIGFCAMWFDDSLNSAWNEAIEPAISEAGYQAKRIDKHPHNSGIVDEILSLIRRSKFVVADLTGDRSGVYFEAGFAKGLRIEVIFTCRKDCFEGIHFDVRHFNFIVWEENKLDEFKDNLSKRIQQTLGQGSDYIVPNA